MEPREKAKAVLLWMQQPRTLPVPLKRGMTIAALALCVAVGERVVLASPTFETCVIHETNAPSDQNERQANASPVPAPIGCAWDVFASNRDDLIAAATVVVAIFTATLWWSTTRMQRATEGTLAHLGREFEAEHRQRLAVAYGLVGPLTWSEVGDGRLTVRFSMDNTGRTPALGIWIDVRAYPHAGDLPEPAAEQGRMSERSRRRAGVKSVGGMSVFPGRTATLDVTVSVPASDIEQVRQWTLRTLNIDNKKMTIAVVGCVDYRTGFDVASHQTGFILEISRSEPEFPNGGFVIDPDVGALRNDQLVLKPSLIAHPIID